MQSLVPRLVFIYFKLEKHQGSDQTNIFQGKEKITMIIFKQRLEHCARSMQRVCLWVVLLVSEFYTWELSLAHYVFAQEQSEYHLDTLHQSAESPSSHLT